MNATYTRLLAILLLGFFFRLSLLSLIHNPGLHDPIHYYNLGRRLAEGQGFTIDYVWHYSSLPGDVVHPIDHWMPLAGVAAGLGIALAGESPHGALTLFLLAGSLLPAVVFLAARQLNFADNGALIAAAFAAALPDFVWISLRTDSTVINALLIGSAVLSLNRGLLHDQKLCILLSGAAAGLAYVTRNDSILFLAVAAFTLVIHSRFGPYRFGRTQTILSFAILLAGFLVTAAPWLIRNLGELGMLGSAETDRMFFMVEHQDHYAYGIPVNFETMLQRQPLGQLIGKRAFEFLAALKQVGLSLAFPLFLFAAIGIVKALREGKRRTLLALAPSALWMLGILLAYPLLLPLKSQAGSFEKAYLSVLPLILPLAASGLQTLRFRPNIKWGVAATTLLWLGYSSYTFVRQEAAKADLYYDSVGVLVRALDDLPDQTGDARLRLMTQDPYIFSYLGYQSIMTPFASREDTLELARRYEIDYLMMPPGRPSLNALYLSREPDQRFVLVARLPEAGAKPFELFGFVHE